MAKKLPRIAPSAKRIGQLRKRVNRNRSSYSKLGGGAAATAASMAIDFLSGFFDFDFELGKKDKLGIYGKALGAGVKGGAADDTLPLPTMETPERVSKENNPTIATISKQLDTLVKTANKIGVYTKEQQDALLNQIKQSKRVASEQQLEQKTPVLPELPDAGQTGSDLQPLDASVADLITKIDELSETLDGMGSGGGGGLGAGGLLAALGLGSLLGGRGKGKAPKVDIDESKLIDKNGRALSGAARESKIAKLTRQAAAATAPTRAGIVRRTAAGIASTAASSKIANFMRSGLRSGGGVAAAATKSTIRGVAGPIIKKALGKTVLKSIPIIGAVAGIGFAIGRLLKGDVMGAGLDLASGLGGPLTAVPALAASVTRDTYASVYGVQPEQDPNFNKNFPELKKTIEDLIRDELGQSVEPKRTPTETEIGEAETPKKLVSAAPVKQPPAVPSPKAPPGASGQGSSEAAPSSGSPAGSASTSAPGAASSPDATKTQSDAQQEVSAISTGQNIAQATMEASESAAAAEQMAIDQTGADISGFDANANAFTPQTNAMSRDGRQGIGDIPSPIYSNPRIIEFQQTLFHGS